MSCFCCLILGNDQISTAVYLKWGNKSSPLFTALCLQYSRNTYAWTLYTSVCLLVVGPKHTSKGSQGFLSSIKTLVLGSREFKNLRGKNVSMLWGRWNVLNEFLCLENFVRRKKSSVRMGQFL